MFTPADDLTADKHTSRMRPQFHSFFNKAAKKLTIKAMKEKTPRKAKVERLTVNKDDKDDDDNGKDDEDDDDDDVNDDNDEMLSNAMGNV